MNRPATGIWMQVLPRLAGLLVFLGALVLALPAIWAVSHATQISSFPNGTPPNGFYVVVRPLAQAHGANTVAAVRWESLPAGAPGKDFTFLLAQAKGSVPGAADVMAYEVIEQRSGSQVIEFHYGNTHDSWSRYEAFADHIVPISYRVVSPLVAIGVFLTLSWAGLHAGRRVKKRLAPQ